MTKEKYKILILTGDAGLGHRSAAEAVRDAIQNNYNDSCCVKIANPFNHPDVPKFIRQSQSDYDSIVQKMPELYELAYDVSDRQVPAKLLEGGFTLILFSVLREMLKKENPDLVITTYPIFTAPLSIVPRIEKMSFPWITAITDLVTVHKIWFNSATTLCAVPTKTVENIALNAGLKPDQIINTGIPVNPQIGILLKKNKSDLRQKFGWDEDITTLLVVGSPRLTSLSTMIKTLDETEYDIQFALVAGGDEDLYQTYKKIQLNHPTHIYNFVENLPEMMRAADLIVCKAGGLTVAESLASGLPLLLIHKLPGQEQGNVNFVLEHEAGVFCQSPEEARAALNKWLKDNKQGLLKVAQNAKAIGRPNAAHQIAEETWKLLHSRS